ncbi:hypothetical protein N7447_005881, partial [Penicillium robsamsonii]|uniref:uncharacterized protein n=1 Tax=Penicillium robsamsonii TaxID=1792511 RepID=UPI0025481F6C
VLILCTWSVIHLNVPIESTPNGKRQEYTRELFLFWTKFKWMFINLAAPEWVLGQAWSTHRSVALLKDRFEEYQRKDSVPWSRSYTYYANMGGFSIRTHPRIGTKDIQSNRRYQLETRPIQYSSYENGNFIFENIRYLCGDLWVLHANQHLLARELGIIETLPSLSQASLDDRNKGNLFVMVLTLGQISWIVIQLIVRLALNLSSSQLEIITLSFAICSIITYSLLLNKPKDVQASHTIKAAKRPSAEDMILIANAGPTGFAFDRASIWVPNNVLSRDTHMSDGNFMIYLASAPALTLFGGIHCIAWNFAFPTEVERLCWHISTIITAGTAPLLWALSGTRGKVIELRVMSDTDRPLLLSIKSVLQGASRLIVLVFVFARLFITVEAFRSLAFLPPGAFLSTWSAGIPHVG